MEPVNYKDIEVDRCTECGGIWFDMLEQVELARVSGAADHVDNGEAEVGVRMNDVENVDCPRCHTPMITLRALHQSHIAYEQCNVCHGTYMDAGEFADYSEVSMREYIAEFLGRSDA
jgi:Zn-finger nucleic acid-binding protein